MPSNAKPMRAQSQHNRLRKRVKALTDEVQSLGGSVELHAVSSPAVTQPVASQPVGGIEAILDKALDLTKGWEKIASLVALVTTNLSGNKSLGALLEILAKDKTLPAASETSSTGGTSLNISDLLSMAENILKTGQLPSGLLPSLPQGQTQDEAIIATADISDGIVDGEVIDAPTSEVTAEVLESIEANIDDSDESQIELAQ